MANTIRDDAGAKYVEMQSARFARKPIPDVFGSGSWTKIRVALWWRTEIPYSTNPAGTPRFRVGLCSGTTNIPGDATPTNAVGLLSNSATWTGYNTGGTTVVHHFACAPFTNVAGVQSIGTDTNVLLGLAALSYSLSGTALFVDITNGSPNFTVQMIGRKPIYGGTMTEAKFESEALQASPTNGDMQSATATTIAFSESNGTLDAAFVNWDIAYLGRLLNWRVIRLS